jgi:hypothetical protein
MNKTIFTLAITTIMAGTMITGCQSSADKIENAKENVKDAEDKMVEAKQNLNIAINDSIQLFKKESEEKISAFEKDIAEFKAKITTVKEETKDEYEKKLASIEQKNNKLKKKLENYKEDGQDNWSQFKNEFNHDMDELGKAFKDLTIKNL